MAPAIDGEQKCRVDAMTDLVKREVSVKELSFMGGEGLLVKKVEYSFRTVGRKFGKLMKGATNLMNSVTQEQITSLGHDEGISFAVDGREVAAERGDVEIVNEDIPGRLVSNGGNLAAALEVELTGDPKKKGVVRELIDRTQNLRKGSDFEVTDQINATVSLNE